VPSAHSFSGGLLLAGRMFCGPAEHALEEIRGAGHASWASVEHMRVDHRGLHVAVAEQLLDRTDVRAPFQQVRGKAMAEGMAARWITDGSRW